MDPMLEKYLDVIEDGAKIIISLGESHAPMIFLLSRTGTGFLFIKSMVSFDASIEPDDEREAYFEAMSRKLLTDENVIGYITIMQGRVINIPTVMRETLTRDDVIGRQKEMLHIGVCMRDGYMHDVFYEIERPLDKQTDVGSKLTHKISKDSTEDNAKGLLVNLFNYLKPKSERPVVPTYEELFNETKQNS